MTRLSRMSWRTRPIEIVNHFAPATGITTVEATNKPFVSIVAGEIWDKPMSRAMLRRWGYRRVEREEPYGLTMVARPWPIWAALRVNVGFCAGFWTVARWARRCGLIHSVVDPSVQTRWRDLRPGRGRN